MRSDTIDSIRIELSGGLKNWLVEGKTHTFGARSVEV